MSGYVIYSEERTDYSTARSRLGAEAMSVWIGTMTWLRFRPQRVHIVELPERYLPHINAVAIAALDEALRPS